MTIDSPQLIEAFVLAGFSAGIMLVLAAWYRTRRIAAGAFVFGAFVLYGNLALSLPMILGISQFGSSWNWLGKVLSIAASLSVVACVPWLSWDRIGGRLPTGIWPWIVGVVAGVAAIVPSVVQMAADGTPPVQWPDLEHVLFQLVMPSVDEELAFRGVMFVILLRYLPPDRESNGIRMGWAAIIVTLLFVMVHTVHYNVETQSLYWSAPLPDSQRLLLAGTCLLAAREITGSIWPAALAHTIMNLGPWLAAYIYFSL